MRIPLLTAIALAAALSTASASDCETWSTSDPEGCWGPNAPWSCEYYYENDMCQPDCIFSFWIYQESNGIDGLQRGDKVVDDTCHGMIDADTIIF